MDLSSADNNPFLIFLFAFVDYFCYNKFVTINYFSTSKGSYLSEFKDCSNRGINIL